MFDGIVSLYQNVVSVLIFILHTRCFRELLVYCEFLTAFRCGIFGFGVLPLGAELSIENIYPVDPAAGISVMFLFGQVESALLLYLSGVLEDDISQQVQEMEVHLLDL